MNSKNQESQTETKTEHQTTKRKKTDTTPQTGDKKKQDSNPPHIAPAARTGKKQSRSQQAQQKKPTMNI